MMDIEEIRKTLPHRFPFLLVDRVLELEQGVRAVGLKNVTINEAHFQGHFPGHAVMPGVLVVESMAQVGGILLLSIVDDPSRQPYFVAMDKVRFRRLVVPGDQLTIEATFLKRKGDTGKVEIVARVGDETAAQGVFTFVLAEEPIDAAEQRREEE